MLQEPKYSVILVEDDEDIRTMFSLRLKEWFDVVTFATAQECLDNLDQLTPGLFVLDWMLPEMDGITLCKKIRAEHKFDLIPIAFYTAVDPTVENIQTAFEAGAETFISKGQSSYFLLANVKTLIEGYSRLQKYIQERKVMLSVLKHDIANLATGLTTGVEVMAMNEAFTGTEMEDLVKPILSSSKKLKILFEDLKEVLVLDNRDFTDTVTRVDIQKILAELNSYIESNQRQVDFVSPMIGKVLCDPCRFSRCLYYIIRFLDKHVPSDRAVSVQVIEQNGAPVFKASVKGKFKDSFEAAMINDPEKDDIDSRHDFLFIHYIESVLAWHKTRMSVFEEQDRSGIMFALPRYS